MEKRYEVSDEFKEICKSNFKTGLTGKIHVSPNTDEAFDITDDDNLVSFKVEDDCYVNDKFIGTTVSRKITVEILNPNNEINIEDKEISVETGTTINDEEELVPFGNFIVQKPDNEETEEKTEFTGYDYMIKFNATYEDRVSYPITVGLLLQDVCDQVGVECGSTEFINSDYEISGNPFTNGEDCKTVLSNIAQLAGGFAHIGRDNKLYIKTLASSSYLLRVKDVHFMTVKELNSLGINSGLQGISDISDEEVNGNHYSEFSKNNKFGPVNSLILSISTLEGENTTIEDDESVEENGLTELTIEDNYFLTDQEEREKVITALWEKLKGLEYLPFKATYYGYPHLDVGDMLCISDTDDKEYVTYVFNHTFEYNGNYKGELETEALTDTQTAYKNTNDIKSKFRRTERVIDKINGVIEDIVEEVSDNTEKISQHEQTIDSITDTISSVETKVETAQTTADNAQASADTAQTTANTAVENAETAQASADEAKETADSAVSQITITSTKLSEVEQTVDSITQTVSSVEEKIETVETVANTAQSTANTAITNSEEAQSTAENASTTASEALTTSAAAVSTAEEAKTTAETAQTTADTANANSESAVATANIANENAESAITTANTANDTANEANTTAQNAQETANNAQTSADTAQETAQTAQDTAEIAQISAEKAQETADSAVTQITTTTTKLAEVEQTVDGIIQTVSSVEESITETQKVIDNLTVGARNLLLGTATQDTEQGNTITNATRTGDTFLGCDVFKTSSAWASIGFNLKRVIEDNDLKVGDILTYSIYNKTDEALSVAEVDAMSVTELDAITTWKSEAHSKTIYVYTSPRRRNKCIKSFR